MTTPENTGEHSIDGEYPAHGLIKARNSAPYFSNFRLADPADVEHLLLGGGPGDGHLPEGRIVEDDVGWDAFPVSDLTPQGPQFPEEGFSSSQLVPGQLDRPCIARRPRCPPPRAAPPLPASHASCVPGRARPRAPPVPAGAPA